MNIFETVKATISVRQAAEYYGLKLSCNQMVNCPFHDDRSPSMKLKDLYEIYRMWCEENNLSPLKKRSFSDAVIASQSKYNLEYCNKITNSAGRRVWGFFGIEAIASPHLNGFCDVSERTYVPEGWDD